MPHISFVAEGKKFMWDGATYMTKKEASDKRQEYEKDGFEVEWVEEEKKYFLYTRRVVTEIILDKDQ